MSHRWMVRRRLEVTRTPPITAPRASILSAVPIQSSGKGYDHSGGPARGAGEESSPTSSLRGKASFVETSHAESLSTGSGNCYCKTMKITSGVRRAARLVETVGTTGARRSSEYFGDNLATCVTTVRIYFDGL
jgi:hypothetical protein